MNCYPCSWSFGKVVAVAASRKPGFLFPLLSSESFKGHPAALFVLRQKECHFTRGHIRVECMALDDVFLFCHTHTHTRLTALCPGLPGWAEPIPEGKTNLDLNEARDSEWQWHQLGHVQVCTSLQTDNHASTPPLSFLQAGCPSCRPTNSVKAVISYWHSWIQSLDLRCLYCMALFASTICAVLILHVCSFICL